MKYLIINGSPHKGNTWKIVQIAMEQIEKVDNQCEFMEIHLREVNLPFCTGCSNCFRLGGETCPHANVMKPILDAMEEADGIIVASTTFFMRETGLLKNFMDHITYFVHRPQFFTKKAMVITSVGGFGGSAAAKSIAGFLKSIGFHKCYLKSVQSISWNAYEANKKEKESVKKCATKFTKDVISAKMGFPDTGLLIPYNLFRGMSIYYVAGTEYKTEDGIYWMDISRRNRGYDSRIPLLPHQKLVAALFYTMGKIAGKKMIVTYKK